jgi:hypothetical protein
VLHKAQAFTKDNKTLSPKILHAVTEKIVTLELAEYATIYAKRDLYRLSIPL